MEAPENSDELMLNTATPLLFGAALKLTTPLDTVAVLFAATPLNWLDSAVSCVWNVLAKEPSVLVGAVRVTLDTWLAVPPLALVTLPSLPV